VLQNVSDTSIASCRTLVMDGRKELDTGSDPAFASAFFNE
jgi:hypothetical protein